jgi:hypothetical protein
VGWAWHFSSRIVIHPQHVDRKTINGNTARDAWPKFFHVHTHASAADVEVVSRQFPQFRGAISIVSGIHEDELELFNLESDSDLVGASRA